MDREDLLAMIKDKIEKDGDTTKISCFSAHRIEDKNPVTLEEIGKLCNEEGIRIKDCQLGCFK